jgi:hypothetical protein
MLRSNDRNSGMYLSVSDMPFVAEFKETEILVEEEDMI